MTISLSNPESAQIIAKIKSYVEPPAGTVNFKPDYAGMYQSIFDAFEIDNRMSPDFNGV